MGKEEIKKKKDVLAACDLGKVFKLETNIIEISSRHPGEKRQQASEAGRLICIKGTC